MAEHVLKKQMSTLFFVCLVGVLCWWFSWLTIKIICKSTFEMHIQREEMPDVGKP